MTLSGLQDPLHLRAIELCRQHRHVEWQIVEVLQEIERTKLHCKLGVASLFQYAVQFLLLSEPVAYNFISVARRASAVPALQEAIQSQSLSVAKASRIVSALNSDNADGLIKFAKTNSKRAVDFEVARINPKAPLAERARPIGENLVQLQVAVSAATFQMLKRAQGLLSQKRSRSVDLGESMGLVLEDYLRRYDPVQKAGRSGKRPIASTGLASHPGPTAKRLCLDRVKSQIMVCKPQRTARPPRTALNAQQKHAVVARDQGRCTHEDAMGNRCTNDRWLHIHHIQPVSQGGSNEPNNLTTLCSAHHDLVHQMAFPLEGQVTWLRSPMRHYGLQSAWKRARAH